MKPQKLFLCIALAASMATAGCFFDTDKDPVDQDGGGTDTGTGTPDGGGSAGLSGTITIASGLDAASYTTGTVYFAVLNECPSMTNPSPTILFAAAEENMDLSSAGASQLFALNGVPAVTGFIWGFLDSNGNADAAAPSPDSGDAMATSCGDQLTIVSGENITDLTVTLDMSMM